MKDILPGMNIQSLGSEAHGSLKPGDILIAVAGVTVRGMPLSRGIRIYSFGLISVISC